MKDDEDYFPIDPRSLDPGDASYNPEIADRVGKGFIGDYASIDGLRISDTFRYYPDYFRDQLEDLYKDGQSSGHKFLFNLNEEAPSPLVWLLLNSPNRFLLACEQCIILYKKKYKEVSSGKRGRLEIDEQKEIVKVKEEIEGFLLDLNLREYQEKLQQEISGLYLDVVGVRDEEKLEDHELEVVDPFVTEHQWLFNNKALKGIEDRIKTFHKEINELIDLLYRSGMLKVVIFEEERIED